LYGCVIAYFLFIHELALNIINWRYGLILLLLMLGLGNFLKMRNRWLILSNEYCGLWCKCDDDLKGGINQVSACRIGLDTNNNIRNNLIWNNVCLNIPMLRLVELTLEP
jgi:hypothetical protein